MKMVRPVGKHGIGASVPNLMRGYAVGRYGVAGSHSHLVEVEFVENEDGTRKCYGASPICNSRLGQFGAHGVRWDEPMNESTVTCKNCRKYKGLMESGQ